MTTQQEKREILAAARATLRKLQLEDWLERAISQPRLRYRTQHDRLVRRPSSFGTGQTATPFRVETGRNGSCWIAL